MDVTQIPYNKLIGISHSERDDRFLKLEFTHNNKNHLGTFHASAQFALAEAGSGLALQSNFPHLAHSVVTVLRKSEIKFKKAAQTEIHAEASISTDAKEQLERQLERKGRGTIEVSVDIVDQNGTVTMTGIFEWYVQKQ